MLVLMLRWQSVELLRVLMLVLVLLVIVITVMVAGSAVVVVSVARSIFRDYGYGGFDLGLACRRRRC